MSSGYFFQSLDYLGFLHNGYQCILVQYLRLNRLTIRMLKYNKDPPLVPGPYCVAGRTWRNWTALSRGGRTCQDVIQSCLYSEYTLFLIQFYLAWQYLNQLNRETFNTGDHWALSENILLCLV